MHYPVSGINSLILSISLASHVSTHLLIHLSAQLYYHHHSHHPSLLHSFTLGSKPTFSTNPSHLKTSFTYRTAFMTTGLDQTYHAHRNLFLVSHFNFLFVPCGGLSWLPVSFLLHVKYTLSYRIDYRRLMNNIYKSGNIPGDFLQTVFITLPKVNQAQDCCDFRTVSLISH